VVRDNDRGHWARDGCASSQVRISQAGELRYCLWDSSLHNFRGKHTIYLCFFAVGDQIGVVPNVAPQKKHRIVMGGLMSTDSIPPARQNEQAFQVAGWAVDPDACRLEREGRRIRVEPKVMQVLQYLVEHAGQVVSRQELEAAIWSDTVVGYEAVTNTIIKLRKALGDNAREPHVIETISKHGYRLIADVTPLAPEAIGDMVFPLPKEPSIAVLPFENLTGDPDQEYLADGLTEEIITVLAKSPYLFVIARNSTFVFKGTAVSVKHVAKQLGVRYVLEGGMQRSGNRLRITAQLIDALSGRHIWAERYDREFDNIFTLQDDITEKIMVALHVEMTVGEDYRDVHARMRSPEAFGYLIKAKVNEFRGTKEDNDTRRELIAKAAAIEPDNPKVWLHQAWGHLREYQYGWSDDPGASFNKAVELANKLHAADPSDSATIGFLGMLSLARGRHEEAIDYGRKSVELAPSSALDNARLGLFLSVSGYPEEAISLVQKAMRLSPFYPAWFAGVLGHAYVIMEDYEKGIFAFEQMVKRKKPHPRAYARLAGIHAILGDADKACEYAAELLRIQPDFTIQGWKRSVSYKYPDDLERQVNMLRLAGLPEGADS